MGTAIIGLLGALLGAILTYAFNRKNAFETRIHQARIDAYKTFAEAVMEYRRAVMDEWFEGHGVDARTEDDDVHRARGAAWSAYYGVRLLTSNENIANLAQQSLTDITALKKLGSRKDLNEQGERCRTKVEEFVEAAREDVQSRGSWRQFL
ncbi:hypothetical protein [Arthrobacter sp. PGP41]|uniref:hypothetical protein n=1 Tax=Arthrobacter sp. PGP41 TaxID=2079227 RepID=UPI001F1FF037|nr:hypothetical protein [Arthrobacter sp. PGP41]